MLYYESWHSSLLSTPPPLPLECQFYLLWYNRNMCTPNIERYGAKPTNVKWTVVRGDTAFLQVQFYEKDETTAFDTDGWTYKSTAYDSAGDLLDELDVVASDGYATIKASPSITENWGTRYGSVVTELKFDLQVRIPDSGEDIIWTPVIGTICVLGDVSPGGL